MDAGTGECVDCPLVRAGMTRRDFVSQSMLAAAAVALAGCGGGSDGPAAVTPTPRPPVISTPISITLANFPELATVGSVVRVSTQPPLAMARTATGLVAFSLECTHEGTQVAIINSARLRCPNHGAEFAFDGTYTGGPQNTSSLFQLSVTLDATGTIARIATS